MEKLYKAQFLWFFQSDALQRCETDEDASFLLSISLVKLFVSRIMEKHELIMSDIASYKAEAQKEFIQLNRKLYELESASISGADADIPDGGSGPKKLYR